MGANSLPILRMEVRMGLLISKVSYVTIGKNLTRSHDQDQFVPASLSKQNTKQSEGSQDKQFWKRASQVAQW